MSDLHRIPARSVAALGLALLLAACGSSRPEDRPVLRLTPTSPSGEVLGLPAGDLDAYKKVMLGWFDRTDSDHDGTLSAAEMQADADRSFDAFDLNHDGSVTPAELTQFRIAAPFQPPPAKPSSRFNRRPLAVLPEAVEGTRPGDFEDFRKVPRLRPTLDPVMSADADADFRVTRAELRGQSLARLARWDGDHDGRLTRDEFLAGVLEPVRDIMEKR
jgi:hypothetical protein